MGVTGERVDWMAEYAEFHQINENAYVNASNVAGMGTVTSAQPSLLSGSTVGSNWSGNGGTLGSGDVGQNLLPVAMKIAAQTIGLDLVAVKPSPGPKIDLLYIDFQYDDTHLGDQDERPQVFKLNADNIADINAAIVEDFAGNPVITQTQGGLKGGRLFYGITSSTALVTKIEPSVKTDIVEFLGFSRIDGLPIFRAFRQANTAGQYNHFAFDASLNTFDSSTSIISLDCLGGIPIFSSCSKTSSEFPFIAKNSRILSV
jgi:hypothetical protein